MYSALQTALVTKKETNLKTQGMKKPENMPYLE
jgi:hypothetical protein